MKEDYYRNSVNKLAFTLLQSISLPFTCKKIITTNKHESESLRGWHGILSIELLTTFNTLVDIDIRIAYNNKFKKQNYIDIGWKKNIFLNKIKINKSAKYIIYIIENKSYLNSELCYENNSKRLKSDSYLEKLSKRYYVGNYWKDIYRIILIADNDLKDVLATLNRTFYDFRSSISQDNTRVQSIKIEPLISVITVVKNNKYFIERCIQSVIHQKYMNYEYIIVDGLSNDGTLKIIEKYKNYIDFVIIESDGGVYEAMNKGLTRANGDFVTFLNSDDFYMNQIKIPSNNTCSYFISSVVYDENNLCYRDNYSKNVPYMPLVHQCLFLKKDDLKFDLQYRISSDFDFFLKHTQSYALKFTSGIVAYSNSGLSKVNAFKRDKENVYILFSNKRYIQFIFMTFIFIIKFFIRKFK